MIVECTFTGKSTDEICLGHGNKCRHYEPHEYEDEWCNEEGYLKYEDNLCLCRHTFKCIMLEVINKK